MYAISAQNGLQTRTWRRYRCMKPGFSCTVKVNDCECADIAARSRLSRWAKGWCASALLHASTRVAVTVPASMRRRGRGGLPGARARFCVRRWHGSPLVHPLAKLRNLATCGNARSAVAEGAFPGTRTRIYAMRRQGSRLVHPGLTQIAACVPAPESGQLGGFPRPAVQCSPQLNCTRGRGW